MNKRISLVRWDSDLANFRFVLLGRGKTPFVLKSIAYLSVQTCDVDLVIAIAEFNGILQSTRVRSFFHISGMKFDYNNILCSYAFSL